MSKEAKSPAAGKWLPISFPVSPSVFIAHQEMAMGRVLSEMEQGTVMTWLELFNQVSTGDLDGAEALDHIADLETEAKTLPARHFLRAARYWLTRALPRPPHDPGDGPAPVPCPAP